MSNSKNFCNKIPPPCPPKTATKTADTLMPGMKCELQPKKANRHAVHRKLLLKTKTLLTFGMTLILPTKKARNQHLRNRQRVSKLSEPTATNEVEISKLKAVTKCVCKSCFNQRTVLCLRKKTCNNKGLSKTCLHKIVCQDRKEK